MTHLSDDELINGGARGAVPESARAHAEACPRCSARLEGFSALAVAAREAEREDFPALAPPAFEELLGGRLGRRFGAEPGVVPVAPVPTAPGSVAPGSVAPRAGVFRSRRVPPLAASLVRWQLRLLPRSLGPVVFALFVTGSFLALTVADHQWGATLFGACLNLAAVVCALGVTAPSRTPRTELLHTLPVAPPVVFVARLVLVLGLDIAAALATSVLVVATGGPSLTALLASWFGPSLLGASVALLVSLWRAPWLGGLAGGALWLAGALGTRPPASGSSMRSDVGVGRVLAGVWSTNVWTVGTALLLFACAALLMTRHGDSSVQR